MTEKNPYIAAGAGTIIISKTASKYHHFSSVISHLSSLISHLLLPMAVLIFLSAAAGTGIISSNLGSNLNGFLFYSNTTRRIVIIFFIGSIILTCSINGLLVCREIAHISFLLASFS